MSDDRLWWQGEVLTDEIQVALNHINGARSRRGWAPGWEVDACEFNISALNKLWSALYMLPEYAALPESKQTDTERLSALFRTLSTEKQAELLAMPSVEALATLVPSILSHHTPGMTQQLYDDIPSDVRERAASAHDEFKGAWARWRDTGARGREVLRKLSRAIYVVRGNFKHGEKTRVGPDPRRTERNRKVAKVALPVLEDVIDFLMGRPSRKLVVYGTLSPGQPNNSVLDDVAGRWSQVTLAGLVSEEEGLPVFRYNTRVERVEVDLLVSKDLAQHWQRLDDFDRGYERQLGLYWQDGIPGVANIYVGSER
jgi:gamma-glutamylcyclotransferase (GGCT)/AIG2-like uncharacterized protein YtfP